MENELQDSSTKTLCSSEDSDKPDPDVVPATHPDTGSGYTIKGLIDYKEDLLSSLKKVQLHLLKWSETPWVL